MPLKIVLKQPVVKMMIVLYSSIIILTAGPSLNQQLKRELFLYH